MLLNAPCPAAVRLHARCTVGGAADVLTEWWKQPVFLFFFNDRAPPGIFPLPLPAALPIYPLGRDPPWNLDPIPLLIPPSEWNALEAGLIQRARLLNCILADRSEEHTSELQSPMY